MTTLSDFDALSQAKHLSSAEIAALIKAMSPRYIRRSQALLDGLDEGVLFRVGRGDRYAAIAVDTALVALVLANVSIYDPLARGRQAQSIRAACTDLGVSYDEAVELTSSEQRIKDILAKAD